MLHRKYSKTASDKLTWNCITSRYKINGIEVYKFYEIVKKYNCKSGHLSMQNPITLTRETSVASPGNPYNNNQFSKYLNFTRGLSE